MEEFDYKAFQAKVLEQIKSGKPLLGKDGAFAPLLENILNAALEGEMDAHLDADERIMGNRRNGRRSKQVQTQMGEITVNTPPETVCQHLNQSLLRSVRPFLQKALQTG